VNPSSTSLIRIEPRRGLAIADLKDLWDYRELLYFLVWRDIKVRYQQTVIGGLWAILQPLLTMVVFTLFFGRLAQFSSEGIPYPLFSYSGLLLWTYFSTAVANAGNSLVGNAHLITKVYFPRLMIPLSAALAGLVDYLIALPILVILHSFYDFTPQISILLLPVILGVAFFSASSLGLWLSALNVRYRDVRHAIPFFIQLLLFATPVIYPLAALPEKYRWVLLFNPISGVLDAHRSCILGHKGVDWPFLAFSTAVTLLIFISGLWYFRRTERSFADII
jgi:lipopolysaccharide transport system permease protein